MSLPKYIRRESGVVYELIATIPPKKFIRKGGYIYRLTDKEASVKTAMMESGEYIDLDRDERGNLVITPTEAFFEDYDWFADQSTVDALHELFEDIVANSGFEFIPPEEIGALTDAPIIGEDVSVLDDGSLSIHGDVWWHANYMVEDPILSLHDKKRLVFNYAPAEKTENEASVKTAMNEAHIQKGSGKIYVQFYDENGYVGREEAWSMEEAEELVREWESGEGGGGSIPDLEKHYDYPSHQRDPYEYASSEETTGHQGEKGEGAAECKTWCDAHYDRPCNCEEGKPDDRYDKYYANAGKV